MLVACILFVGSEAVTMAKQTTVSFDTGSKILFSDVLGGSALNAGTKADGDGCVFEIGYYDAATESDKFAGNWIALTGPISRNTAFASSTIGDNAASGSGSGTVAGSLTFKAGSSAVGNDLPSPGQFLAIRFCNASTLGGASSYNAVSCAAWKWQMPALPPEDPVLTISLDDPALEWLGGPLSAFVAGKSRKVSDVALTWNVPDEVDQGTELSGVHLNASSNVPGTVVYSPEAGTVLKAGAQTLSATFIPNDELVFRKVTKTVTMKVARVVPRFSNLPGDIAVAATSNAGAVVEYTMPTATDRLGVTSITTSHASGTVFPIGTTNVVFTAKNTAGNVQVETFRVTVFERNHAPVFVKGADQVVWEDAGRQSITNWATRISAGVDYEAGQAMRFLVMNNNPRLFAVPPTLSADGTLLYKTATGANGLARVTVKLQDNGGTKNGGENTSLEQTFTIKVAARNSAPSFVGKPQITVPWDAGEQVFSSWAKEISAGPRNESDQQCDFRIVPKQGVELFEVVPSISTDGTLRFKPAKNASGVALFGVTLQDNGGTANGGVDTSAELLLKITVTSSIEEVGTYKGLVKAADPEKKAHAKAGYLVFTSTAKNSFSAKLSLGSTDYPLTGVVGNDGVVRGVGVKGALGSDAFVLKRKGMTDLILKLHLDVSEGTDLLTGRILDGEHEFSTVEGARVIYSVPGASAARQKQAPLERVGKYTTLLMPTDTGLAANVVPHASGYGTLELLGSGLASFAGKLPDGTSFSGAWPLRKDGGMSFFVRDYQGNGSISGSWVFRDVPEVSDLDGTLEWFRPANFGVKTLYYGGWEHGVRVSLIGSEYRVPAAGANALAGLGAVDPREGNAEVVFSEGDLKGDMTLGINMSRSAGQGLGAAGASVMSIAVNESSGLWNGRFKHPVLRKTVAIQGGVVFQKQSLAVGFFLGATESGSVEIEGRRPKTK